MVDNKSKTSLIRHIQKTHITNEDKAPLTSRRTCAHVLVTEKNRLIYKRHLSYTCDFITEFQGRLDPTMNIDMHIFSACTQYGHKRIHFSRVTYERLVHVHFPCKCCKISPFTCRVCTCRIIHCMYLASILTLGPLASRSLFFDVQVLTLLLEKYSLFARANLCYPTTRRRSYFSTIFAAHLHVYTNTMGFKRSFTNIVLVLRTRIILLSSFMIYYFYICCSGSFPIIRPR